MDLTANYKKWTKDALVERIKELENELKRQKSSSNISSTGTQQNENEPSSLASLEAPQQKKEKKTKVLDQSKYSTRFIALKLAYIGKKYNGFEYQSSGDMSTIEEELWKALVKACLIFPDPARPNEVDWSICEYSKCGRTDRGVSAFGQVVALRVRSNKPVRQKRKPAAADEVLAQGNEGSEMLTTAEESKSVSMADGGDDTSSPAVEDELESDEAPFPLEKEIKYCRMLNRLLPPDIRIYAWCPNPGPEFSARFNCRERQYRYFFTQPAFAPIPNFLEEDCNINKVKKEAKKPKDGWLNIDAMRKAAKLFEGLHDFRNFCKIDASKQITNFQRRIFEADIVEVDGVDTNISYLNGPQFRDPNVSSSSVAPDTRFPKVYYFHVRGSAFLWHQIRCMVAILFVVGQGHESPSLVSSLLDVEKHPSRPNYTLAEDAPLVLWDCIFGRDNEQGAADEVDWIYIGGASSSSPSSPSSPSSGNGAGESPLSLHGVSGLMDELWKGWHAKKMDEILANQLVEWLCHKTDVHRVATEEELAASGDANSIRKIRDGRSTRVYDGGNSARFAGQYVPVLEKSLIPSAEELNDRWAQRKGFKNAEEMRATGKWREAIKAAKEEKDAEGVAGE